MRSRSSGSTVVEVDASTTAVGFSERASTQTRPLQRPSAPARAMLSQPWKSQPPDNRIVSSGLAVPFTRSNARCDPGKLLVARTAAPARGDSISM